MATDPREYFPTAINIGNYIPSLDDIQNSALTLKSTVVDIVKGRNNNNGLAVHTVTYMKFDEWTQHNQTHYYLIIGTSTGFQVFLLHDSRNRQESKQSKQSKQGKQTQPTQPAQPTQQSLNGSPLLNGIPGSPHHSPKKLHKKALMGSDNLEMIKVAPGGSKQQRQIRTPISCATILCNNHSNNEINKKNRDGPVLAVSPANEVHNFDSKCVRLYSLMEQQYTHTYRLRTRVHGILSKPNVLIVATSKEIIVIDPMTDEKLYRKSCAPNPINGVIAALGHRWLAFADTKLRQTNVGTHILPRNNSVTHSTNAIHYTVGSAHKDKDKLQTQQTQTQQSNKDKDKGQGKGKGTQKEINRPEMEGKDIETERQDIETEMSFSDQISKTVTKVSSFLTDSFVETRKEVSKQVKKQQNNIASVQKKEESEQNSLNSYFKTNSHLYCAEPPNHGIISIIDIAKGELLINFIAHHNCPLMYIVFDPSGTLLVTADRDGIYINVFQIIGFPITHKQHSNHDSHGHRTTIYRHLYRIYRGFRYAIIRDITFSKNSKWMAISSARGTIHCYQICREGGTNNVNKTYDLQSQKKIHNEMKETRKDNVGISTTTGGTKIVSKFSFLGSNSLLVQTPTKFYQYSIELNDTAVSEGNTDSDRIKVEHLHTFTCRDLYNAQSVSYPYLHNQLYPSFAAYALDNHSNTKTWLSNTELCPINRFSEVSLWGNPQFTFYSYNKEEKTDNDPYSFLDASHINNATEIVLNEMSPIIGPRLTQPPDIQVSITDLQQTIENAMGTIIDEQNSAKQTQTAEIINDKSKPKSIEPNNSNKNNMLALDFDEIYIKNESNNNLSQSDSDDFQLVD